MEKAWKISGRKITYIVVSMMLICICLWGYVKITGAPKKQVDILFLGDSLIGQYRDETSIPYLVEKELGMTAFNGAFGGTSYAKLNLEDKSTFQKDGLNFPSLARAISYEDFGVQQSVYIRESATEHFPQVVDELEQIDARELKYLIIEYGMNDYFAGVPLENPKDGYDEYTVAGALRSALKVLRKSLPDLQIILISPTYNWYLNTQENCENKDFGGGYMPEYVNTIAEVAAEFDVGYMDIYTDFYPNKTNQDAMIYTEDGVHPNPEGRKKIAEAIVDYIEND